MDYASESGAKIVLPHKRRSIVLAAAILIAVFSVFCSGGRDVSGLAEASMNFDLSWVRPFLVRISAHIDGFGETEIDALVDQVSSMAIDSEKSWDFDVVYQGATVPLHIRVFMDDVESPEVYFFTTPELAALINRELEAFSADQGI